MCLTAITHEYKDPLQNKKAYKVMDRRPGCFHPNTEIQKGKYYFQFFNRHPACHFGKTVVAESRIVWTDSGTEYATGFHCFESINAAKAWCESFDIIVEVNMEDVRIRGINGYHYEATDGVIISRESVTYVCDKLTFGKIVFRR